MPTGGTCPEGDIIKFGRIKISAVVFVAFGAFVAFVAQKLG